MSVMRFVCTALWQFRSASLLILSAQVVCQMESGKKTMTDALLYCVGRQANTDTLNVEAAGLKTDERGRLTVRSPFPNCDLSVPGPVLTVALHMSVGCAFISEDTRR